jgi:ABC-type Fe3+/spermidine/putrescine transport system ATPase subunit
MLSVENVAVRYTDLAVLHGVSLEIEAGEIVCLLGPSGCGKTTLLRVIAGLMEDYTGTVSWENADLRPLPPHQRDFGLMFQDYALFPHLNVSRNVAFGLEMRHYPRAEQQNRVKEMLSLVGLSGYENRDVNELSGGEKQRVALARSLAPQPRLLMLDEPLGSLDALLRERLVLELREIIRAQGLTAIYVTHDRQEAYAIADRIVIMSAGRIMQIDRPAALYHAPRTQFVAQFLGFRNVYPVLSFDRGIAETAIGRLPLTSPAAAILLHPDGLHVADDGDLVGTVQERLFTGESVVITTQVGRGLVTLAVPSVDAKQLVGETIRLSAKNIVPLLE